MTAKEFLNRDESGVFNEQDIVHAMIGFAKLHAINIMKKCSKSELEFQRNLQHNYPLTNIK